MDRPFWIFLHLHEHKKNSNWNSEFIDECVYVCPEIPKFVWNFFKEISSLKWLWLSCTNSLTPFSEAFMGSGNKTELNEVKLYVSWK